MAGVNKVILLGRLGADPDLEHVGDKGTAVSKFNVATARNWKGPDGPREETQWTRVVVWGKTAENCAQYLVKGQRVYLEGRLQTRNWEDKDGNRRYMTEVIAHVVIFLERPKSRQESPDTHPPFKGPGGADVDPNYYDGEIPF